MFHVQHTVDARDNFSLVDSKPEYLKEKENLYSC